MNLASVLGEGAAGSFAPEWLKRQAKQVQVRLRSLDPGSLVSGEWFRRLAERYIRYHSRTISEAYWDQKYPGLSIEQRAERHIHSVGQRASLAGGLAALGTSAGELASYFTEGVGAPIGIPAALITMALEATYTATLQLDLVCDLGSIHGVPFDVDDVGDVTALFRLALGLREPPVESDGGHPGGSRLMESLEAIEGSEAGRQIGRKLLQEALLRNIVPVVDIAISMQWNYAATERLGRAVLRHVRFRAALRQLLSRLKLQALAEPEMLVEGAWILATLTGEANPESALAIARIVDAMPEESREHITTDRAFGEDEQEWFDALPLVPPRMHETLLDVLSLVAAADGAITVPEKRFLRRVGRHLGRPVDLERADTISRMLDSGEQLAPRTAAASMTQPEQGAS